MRFAPTIEKHVQTVARPAAFCACAMVPLLNPFGGVPNFADVYRYAWERAQQSIASQPVHFPYQPSLN